MPGLIDELKARRATAVEAQRAEDEARCERFRVIRAKAPRFWAATVGHAAAVCADIVREFGTGDDLYCRMEREPGDGVVTLTTRRGQRSVRCTLSLDAGSVFVVTNTREMNSGESAPKHGDCRFQLDRSDNLHVVTPSGACATPEIFAEYLVRQAIGAA